MAAFQDKLLINTGITKNTKMDLSCSTITTGSFFELIPVYIKEMVPGESLKVVSEEFTRLQPLNVPTFGRGNVNTRGFFVPMRSIMYGFDEFVTDSPFVSGALNSSTSPTAIIPGTVVTLHAEQMTEEFLRATGVTGYVNVFPDGHLWGNSSTTAGGAYDYVINVQGTPWYITLNEQGRRVKKMIEALGYKVLPQKTTSLGTFSNVPELEWSAMPLLAVAKIYCDWYINSGYGMLYEEALYIERILKNATINNSNMRLGVAELGRLMDFIVMANYDSDYFVSAWDNPVSPNPGAYSAMTITDVTLKGFGPGTNGVYPIFGSGNVDNLGVTNSIATSGTPTTVMDYGSNNGRLGVSVSDYQHVALKSLTDYMKRHQMAGVRAFDRFLARFGKALSDAQLRRSKYLGAHKGALQFGDVMSTASNTQNGSGLGAFAGKGISYDKGSFEYTTNEYGFFVLIASIIPTVGYYQGIDRSILHVNKLDFWTPEFDNLGTQTIAANELYVPTDGTTDLVYTYSYTFGFTPRYSEYKVAKDRLLGDFTVPSVNHSGDLDAWHFMRKFSDSDFSYSSNVVHSKDFVTGAVDGAQYNRIFQTWDSKDPVDMFWMIWHFNVISNSPMKSMYDTYEFENKGKNVQEQVNGVKMN